MYNHVIFIQNIYLFRNPPASTRPSALRRCGPPPRALLCIRNSDVEALCPQALLVSLDELHAVLMLGTLLRDACVPGTLAGRRQNKCKIQSRSVSCPNASGVTSRSLRDDLSLSLSLSVLGVFASKWRGCPRSHLRFRAGAADLLLRLPVSPSPRGLLIAPPCHRQLPLSQTTTSPAHQRSPGSPGSPGLGIRIPDPEFFGPRVWGRGSSKQGWENFFCWRRGRRARQGLRSGEAEGARARPF